MAEGSSEEHQLTGVDALIGGGGLGDLTAIGCDVAGVGADVEVGSAAVVSPLVRGEVGAVVLHAVFSFGGDLGAQGSRRTPGSDRPRDHSLGDQVVGCPVDLGGLKSHAFEQGLRGFEDLGDHRHVGAILLSVPHPGQKAGAGGGGAGGEVFPPAHSLLDPRSPGRREVRAGLAERGEPVVQRSCFLAVSEKLECLLEVKLVLVGERGKGDVSEGGASAAVVDPFDELVLQGSDVGGHRSPSAGSEGDPGYGAPLTALGVPMVLAAVPTTRWSTACSGLATD
ncbi:hypothetical protein [Kitasatospora sp. NPDC005748]|uniref:hypothetical protein n=1 Tax=Kitasatospora sp. NPDC005748 TaxID=3157063 RepID=UPI0033C30F94